MLISKLKLLSRAFSVMLLPLTFLFTFSAHAQMAMPKLVAKVAGSVVQILVFIPPGTNLPASVPQVIRESFGKETTFLMGTGMFVNDSGDVITASHVGATAQEWVDALIRSGVNADLMIGMPLPNVENKQIRSQGTQSRSARLVDTDGSRDLAHLVMPVSPFHPHRQQRAKQGYVRMASNPEPSTVKFATARAKDGEAIFMCGFPLGSENLVTTQGSIASAWKLKIPENARELGGKEKLDMYQGDIRIDRGNSGGPVFRSKDGAVLGLAVEMQNSSSAFAFFIPAKYITEFLDKSHVRYARSK